ncbi:MAG: BON domain-containing protein, partial [Desulfobacterales bacterium]
AGVARRGCPPHLPRRETASPPDHSPYSGKLKVLAVGRLSRYKGFDVLMRAAARSSDVEVMIAGEGQERRRLERFPKQTSPGEYVDDSVITTKVKSLLAADDFLKSFQISVKTYKGTVQLSGFVDSQAAVDKASEIARSVKGVTSVKNDLIVK